MRLREHEVRNNQNKAVESSTVRNNEVSWVRGNRKTQKGAQVLTRESYLESWKDQVEAIGKVIPEKEQERC